MIFSTQQASRRFIFYHCGIARQFVEEEIIRVVIIQGRDFADQRIAIDGIEHVI